MEVSEEVARKMRANRFDILNVDPEKDATKIANQIDDPALRGRLKGDIQRQLTKQKEAFRKELIKDPATYVVNGDEGIRDLAGSLASGEPGQWEGYKASMDTKFDELGVANVNRKYLPEGIRNHYNNSINGAISEGNYQAAAAVLEDFERSTGNDSFLMYRELNLKNKNMATTLEANHLDRARMIQDLANPDELKGAYKSVEGAMSDSDIDTDLRQDPLYRAFSDDISSAGITNAESFAAIAKNEYKRGIISGLSHKEAMTEAYRSFNDNYEMVPNRESFIPVKKGEANPDNIEAFITENKGNIDSVSYTHLTLPTICSV